MKKEVMENFTFTGRIEGKEVHRRTTYLMSLCKLIAEQRERSIIKKEILLSVTNERKLGKAMIACILKEYST